MTESDDIGWVTGCTLARMEAMRTPILLRAVVSALSSWLFQNFTKTGQLQELLKEHAIQASMSRKGNCWDNVPVESFFGTLKTECAPASRYENHTAARSALFDYIETFYNRKRRHSALGYLSPLAFEQRTRKELETHV
ncbi:MAG: transposase [Ktedonobacteraceae bacterium]|nr:transposase [Ktedonobacteraceae bacterium]